MLPQKTVEDIVASAKMFVAAADDFRSDFRTSFAMAVPDEDLVVLARVLLQCRDVPKFVPKVAKKPAPKKAKKPAPKKAKKTPKRAKELHEIRIALRPALTKSESQALALMPLDKPFWVKELPTVVRSHPNIVQIIRNLHRMGYIKVVQVGTDKCKLWQRVSPAKTR